jgi:hypothetical protein
MAAALATAAGGGAYGQSADALIDKLVDKGILTVKEANELREEADKDFSKAYSVKSGMPDWVTAFKLNGDVRLRNEFFFLPDGQAPDGTTLAMDRTRFRHRLRFGAIATIMEKFEAGFRLTSSDPVSGGGYGGDPISGNSTFTSNGSKKFVYLDLVYAKWNPLNNPDWSLTLTGGKMENPFVFSDIVFDADYTPEGAAFNLVYNLNKNHAMKLNGSAFALNELGAAAHDTYLYGAQWRLDSTWTPKLQSSLGVAALSLSGRGPLGANLANGAVPNQNYGNTRDAAGNLAQNYNPIIADAAFTYTLDSFPFYKAAFPIKLAADYVYNPAVAKDNYAWSAGITLGKAGKRGLWEINYRYKYLGADFWYEELVDSDTGGFYGVAAVGGAAGYRAGTNLRGHVIKASYSPTDSLSINLSYYLMDLINGYGNPLASSQKGEAGRLQLDFVWKF